MPSSRGSSRRRDGTCISMSSALAGRFFLPLGSPGKPSLNLFILNEHLLHSMWFAKLLNLFTHLIITKRPRVGSTAFSVLRKMQ